MTNNFTEQVQHRSVHVAPATHLRGDFHLPGDKSISHRSSLISALGSGISRIANYSTARDCQKTLECLSALGISISQQSGQIIIKGVGLDGLRQADHSLDAGNSGSTMRMIAGILAGQPFPTEINGDKSLSQRPMQRIIQPLVRMGARIEARDDNFAPLRIHGGNLQAIEYVLPIASAQVKSCLLFAGLFANGLTSVIERTPTRNHTEIMLQECGASVTKRSFSGRVCVSVAGKQMLNPLGEYTVAGDFSSAAFFLVAALLTPESELRMHHIGINSSRTALIDVLRAMGGEVMIENSRLAHGELVADLTSGYSRLKGKIELSGTVIANLIDEIPILAIVGTQLYGTLTIRDAHELRVKECDRIRAIVDNLRRMKVKIEEFDDGFQLSGPQNLRGARIDSHGDHRIAMAFTIAGLIADGETEIVGAEATEISLPEFFRTLSDCGASVTLR